MIRLVLVGAAISTVFVACDNADKPPGLTADLTDLCKAVGSSVDQAAQERAFFDRAHDAIHTLAQRVTKEHPEVAAELLESKQRVEANLSKAKRTVPAREFGDLINAADRALAEIDAPEIRCE